MAREKSVTFTLRMTPEENALLKRAAEVDQRSLQGFVLRVALRQARAVLRQAEQERQDLGEGGR